jgi:hypothetical protein
MTLLPQLLAFTLALGALLVLSRWINRQVQIIGLRVTGSSTITIMLYYLVMFPGILLHELSHYVTALILGMKVGKFSLGPKVRRNAIELGSVTVSSGGTVRDSLVGLAPFIAGTLVLLLVSYQVFDVARLGEAWTAGGWPAALGALDGIWLVPDFWLWAYVIFVVSNAMTPSEADRQPWLVAGAYLLIAIVIAWLLGGLPVLADALGPEVQGTLQLLTLGFTFTVAVNLVIGVFLLIVEALVMGLKGQQR